MSEIKSVRITDIGHVRIEVADNDTESYFMTAFIQGTVPDDLLDLKLTKEPKVPKGYFFARHHLVVFSEIESLSAGVINFKSGKSIKIEEVWDGDNVSAFMAAYEPWLDYQNAPRVVCGEPVMRPSGENLE